MKQIDLKLTPPQFDLDPAATEQLAAYTAKLEDILRTIVDSVQIIKIVDSAPAVTELENKGNEIGENLSEVVILDDATQSNRRIYYKNSAGTLRFIESD